MRVYRNLFVCAFPGPLRPQIPALCPLNSEIDKKVRIRRASKGVFTGVLVKGQYTIEINGVLHSIMKLILLCGLASPERPDPFLADGDQSISPVRQLQTDGDQGNCEAGEVRHPPRYDKHHCC